MNPTARKLALPIAFLAVGLPVGIGAVIAMGDPEAAEKVLRQGRVQVGVHDGRAS